MRTTMAAMTLLLAMMLSGCANVDVNVNDKPRTYAVSMTDSQFTPNSLSAKQNDDVRWTNNGQILHAVSIHKAGDPVTTLKKDGDVAKGSSTEFKFEETGTFHVYCKYHSQGTAGSFGSGMVMTVTVSSRS